MAIISHDDLKELGIENPGPATFDLTNEPIRAIDLGPPHNSFGRGNARDFAGASYEQLVRSTRPHAGTFVPEDKYYTEIRLPSSYRKFKKVFSTRSRIARIGMMAQWLPEVRGAGKDVMPVRVTVKGTQVRLPGDYKISQLMLVEKGTRRLSKDEVNAALDSGDIYVKSPRIQDDGSLMLRVGRGFYEYTGGVLSPGADMSRHFRRCSDEEYLKFRGSNHFYLGCTEPIYIGPRHVGLLFGVDQGFLVHLNATIVHPTSRLSQTLELYPLNGGGQIRTGQDACKLFVYPLSSPVPTDLKGTFSQPGEDGYAVQEGPLLSRLL